MKFDKFHEQSLENDSIMDFVDSMKREESQSNIQEIIDTNQYNFPKVPSKFQLLKFIQPTGLNSFGNDELDINANFDIGVYQNNSYCSNISKENKEINLLHQDNLQFEESHLNSKLYTREDGSIMLDPPISINSATKLLNRRSNSDSNLFLSQKIIPNEYKHFENLFIHNKKIFKIEKIKIISKVGENTENNFYSNVKIPKSNYLQIPEIINSKKDLQNEITCKPRKYSMINYCSAQTNNSQGDLKNIKDSLIVSQNENKKPIFSNKIDLGFNLNLNLNSDLDLDLEKNLNSKIDSQRVEEEKSELLNVVKISKEERKLKIQKYLTKKFRRNYKKRTIYKIRKVIAEKRIRKNGKFICKTEERELKKNSKKACPENKQ